MLETWTRQCWWLVTGGRGTPRWTERSRLRTSGQRAPAASSPPPAHSTRGADTVGGHAEAREAGDKTSVNILVARSISAGQPTQILTFNRRARKHDRESIISCSDKMSAWPKCEPQWWLVRWWPVDSGLTPDPGPVMCYNGLPHTQLGLSGWTSDQPSIPPW